MQAYDYVYGDGLLSVVRGYVHSKGVWALKPIYDIEHGWKKCSHSSQLVDGSRDLTCAWVLEQDNIVLPRADFRFVAKRNRWPVHDLRERLPQPLGELTDFLYSRDASLFLFGSRLLGREQRDSDWDFVIAGPDSPRHLLEEALSVLDGAALLTEQEVAGIADKYRYPQSMISTNDLRFVMSRCLPYITCDGTRIDFFAVGDSDRHPLPASLSHSQQVTAEGWILPSSGSSFLMPRSLLISTLEGPVTVRHACWLLGGLEQLQGHYVEFSGLAVADTGELWFAPRESRLALRRGNATSLQHAP